LCGALAILFAASSGLALTNIIGPAYEYLPVSADQSKFSPAERLEVNFDSQFLLRGYDVVHKDETTFDVTLYWECLQARGQDYTVFVHMLDAEGERIGQHDSMPVNNGYPTTLWRRGEWIKDTHSIPVAYPLPSNLSLIAGFYDATTMRRVPVLGVAGEPIDDKVRISPGGLN
jgi:hypothetical protein